MLRKKKHIDNKNFVAHYDYTRNYNVSFRSDNEYTNADDSPFFNKNVNEAMFFSYSIAEGVDDYLKLAHEAIFFLIGQNVFFSSASFNPDSSREMAATNVYDYFFNI